ncbi:ATP-binding cassette domain-containing protein [Companilactobacillus hulinensis]|uniref:ATP-binding cassette domain-containing protein n=1 Tax=Companilactobacillus hulinensis TaxID=2486007 RepID=UPI000F76E2D8|nr:ATP-binding cassette domain-containing protein [Companilactobacillus hulinensis]
MAIVELITVKDLSLQNEGYFAFKHVAFSLTQNETISIVGDSGSGKSQLLETLAKLKNADSGKVVYTPGVRIGYLPQFDPQIVNKTVRNYLEEVRRLTGKLAVSSAQLKGLVAYMGMSPYLDRPVIQLSYGLKQRIGFLSAVAGHPNVLLLDEPFSFQNSKYTGNMLDIIHDLKNNGSGIIVASSYQDGSISNYFDSNYIMKNKSLEQVKDKAKEIKCMLIFTVKSDSMALTTDISKYLAANVSNLVELKIPLGMKDAIIKEMIDLNYQFEGARNLED